MREELDYRRNELMPELIEEVKRTRPRTRTAAASAISRG